MIKHIIFSSALAILGLVVHAQENSPVILATSTGKVIYLSPDGGDKQKLKDGAVLKRDGKLKLRKRSKATLLADGRFQHVAGKKYVSLAELFPPSGESLAGLNFDLTFSQYITAAIQMAAMTTNTGDAWGVVKTTSGTGDGWGTVKTTSGTGDGWGVVKTTSGTGDGWGTVKTTSGTGDGWGGKGTELFAIQPFGKVADGETITFHWSRPAGDRTYKLLIVDDMNQTKLETTTKDTFYTVDLRKHGLVLGEGYQWSVSSADAPALQSNSLIIEVYGGDDQGAAIQRAERSPLYEQSNESLRGLIKAVSLERSDWYGAAADTYATVQRADPDNTLVRLMHAAFWMRYGLKEMAEAAFR